MPETYSFGSTPITCHAWNRDRSQLALSPNNHEVHVYKFVAGKWQLLDTLDEHVQRVTGIDWAATSNRIVTCGADRNAYVWSQEANGKWKPMLVILRINRAATCVKWSPLENKFAVGSSARLISVCYFEQENDWWVSKHIKKPLRSTVTSLDWHPNNVLIGCGSSDFKARVFSAFIKEVDEKSASTCWGKKMTFGTMMNEFSNGGWVHSVSFHGGGDILAWVGHNSSISIANQALPNPLTTILTQFLPFTSCTWVSNNILLVAGHDCTPMQYMYDGQGKITYMGKVDQEKKVGTQKVSALNHFRNLDSRAQSQEENETTLETVHQNTITDMQIHSGDKMQCVKFSSASIDGQMIIWDYKSLESSMRSMQI